MLPLFIGSILAILYFCLYPFVLDLTRLFHWPQHRFPSSLAQIRDFGLNWLLFLPLGLFGTLQNRNRIAWVFVFGVSLSAAIEMVQLWIPGRHSNFFDIVANGLGVGSGIALALVLPKEMIQGRWVGLHTPVQIVVCLVFAASKTAPFFPSISPYPLITKWKLFVQSPWPLEQVLLGLAEVALVWILIRNATRLAWFVLAAAPLGAFFIQGGSWRPGVLFGNLVGYGLTALPRTYWNGWPPAIGWLVLTASIQLLPFEFSANQEFNWIPFSNLLDLRISTLGILADKFLLYFGLVFFL